MMEHCFCNINHLSHNILEKYVSYRNECQLLCNFLMSKFDCWNIYLVEHDVDVFRLNFCSRTNRLKDTSFILTKDQLRNIKCTLDEIIIPAIVAIEEESNRSDCECQM